MKSTGIDIIPVKNKKDLDAFIKFPYHHYKNNPFWVPPLLMDQKVLLNSDKHPFYKHAKTQFFLASKNGKATGRIAAIVDDKHNKFHNEKTGFFGFFETIEDYDVAAQLLTAARSWIMDQNMNLFRGPVNPSQNEDCGFITDAFDSPPVIMMTYNPPYYIDFIEKFGFKKAMDLYAYYIDDHNPPPEKLVRVANIVKRKVNLTIRPLNMKDFNNEAKKVWYVYNHAWEKNWGFVPMTEEEFNHLAKNLKQVVVPELALMAEIEGQPVGFSLALPDMNQALIHLNGRLFPFGLLKLLWYSKKIDMIRIIIMGVIQQYRQRGIDSILYIDTWNNGVKKGYHRGEMSWILENNTMMNRTSKMLGGHVYKTYRMYQIEL